MWIISFFPDFVTHVITFLGVLGVMAVSIPLIWNLIPGVALYRLPVQIISVMLLSFGLFLEGGISEKEVWEAKVSALEKKVSEAEAKSARVDTKIVTKLLTKKQVVKEKGDTITEYIEREVVKYDNTCQIPVEVIRSHNAAAMNDLLLLVPTNAHNALAVPTIKLAPKHE
jgi:hypothetical protein